jgi:type VI secretion system protein ImpF
LARQPTIQFRHSLWDRLTIPDLARGPGVGTSSSRETERIKDSVRRDLEWLLNSKRPPVAIPEGMTALDQSLMTYGLPDITSLAPGDTLELERFQRTLEAVIRNFEPRLSQVKVAFTPLDEDGHHASLHYRIDALLRLDPSPEPIVFDTVLDLGNRAFIVRRDGT